jgi:DNA-binding NtrC family response regulator
VRYFLDRFAAREGRPAPTLERDAYAALLAHDFPGQHPRAREPARGRRGPFAGRHDPAGGPAVAAPAGRACEGARPAGDEEIPDLRALEERHIQRVLRLAGGNKSRAARLLGISRRTLYRNAGGTISLCINCPIIHQLIKSY